MTDFLGNKIEVGDRIITIDSNNGTLTNGIVLNASGDRIVHIVLNGTDAVYSTDALNVINIERRS